MSLAGVVEELETLGLQICLTSPRLLVIMSSKTSPSSAKETLAPSSPSYINNPLKLQVPKHRLDYSIRAFKKFYRGKVEWYPWCLFIICSI